MKTFEQIMVELRKKQYSPVYFLAGEEPYFIDKVCEKIENEALDEMSQSFDQQVVYGRDLMDAAQIISMSRVFPMMGGKRVVIVKEAQALKKWENFELYWQNPMESTILVICYKGKPNGTLKAFKGLNKTDYYAEFAQLRDYQINKWIVDYIAQWNASSRKSGEVSIDPSVVQLLSDNLGTDLNRIEKELQKLVNGCPEGTRVIDAALVERNIGISKDFNAFELQAALIAGDVVKANRISQYFAANPKEHSIIKEMIMLYRFFSTLMIYHYLPDKNAQTAAPILGLSPYAMKDYPLAARRFSKGKTFNIIGYIRQADARSKGIDYPTAANEADIWKELIYKILH